MCGGAPWSVVKYCRRRRESEFWGFRFKSLRGPNSRFENDHFWGPSCRLGLGLILIWVFRIMGSDLGVIGFSSVFGIGCLVFDYGVSARGPW